MEVRHNKNGVHTIERTYCSIKPRSILGGLLLRFAHFVFIKFMIFKKEEFGNVLALCTVCNYSRKANISRKLFPLKIT